jgi:uridine kinase
MRGSYPAPSDTANRSPWPVPVIGSEGLSADALPDVPSKAGRDDGAPRKSCGRPANLGAVSATHLARFDHAAWGRNTPLIIGVAGGSGSGKTTIAEALVEAIEGVAYVKHDAYYRDLPWLTFEQRSKVNYDHPASLETDLLVRNLERLRAGHPFERPVYDFGQHVRAEATVSIAPAPVVIVEGILVLAERELRDLMDLKVFVDTDADLRLARRLERDIAERGRSAASVIAQYLASVRPMHLEFVEPSKRYADIIIPGGMRVGAVATILELIRARMR